jgi:hypothetical protein
MLSAANLVTTAEMINPIIANTVREKRRKNKLQSVSPRMDRMKITGVANVPMATAMRRTMVMMSEITVTTADMMCSFVWKAVCLMYLVWHK